MYTEMHIYTEYTRLGGCHEFHANSGTNCNTVQHTATHCNTLQHTATHCNSQEGECRRSNTNSGAHCNTLQHTATHCNTLQHSATHRITLQHTATHCNTLHHTTGRVPPIQRKQWDKLRDSERAAAVQLGYCNKLWESEDKSAFRKKKRRNIYPSFDNPKYDLYQ